MPPRDRHKPRSLPGRLVFYLLVGLPPVLGLVHLGQTFVLLGQAQSHEEITLGPSRGLAGRSKFESHFAGRE